MSFCGFHSISKYQYCGSDFSRYSKLTDLYYARSQNYEIYLLALSCPSVCPSVRVEQLCSEWADYHEIWHASIFWKSVEKIQVSLKSDKNDVFLHDNRYTFLITSRSLLLRMRHVSDKSCIENQNTHFMLGNVPSKLVSFTRQCEIIPQRCRGHRWQYGARALHAGQLRLQTHAHKCKTYCFSTATYVAATLHTFTL